MFVTSYRRYVSVHVYVVIKNSVFIFNFSTGLMFNISEAIAIEIRAHVNNNTLHGVYATYVGLNCFSPLINLMRHPLWGRNQVSVHC